MNLSRCFAALIVGMTVSLAIASKSPVGTWTGHIVVNFPKATPQQEQQMAQAKAMLAKMKVSLTFKGDHTYISTQSGGPMGSKTDNGKWSQAGDDVTITSLGTGPGKGIAQHFQMSKDGHSLKLDTSRMGGSVKVTFTR